jgi:hypothetical protein
MTPQTAFAVLVAAGLALTGWAPIATTALEPAMVMQKTHR